MQNKLSEKLTESVRGTDKESVLKNPKAGYLTTPPFRDEWARKSTEHYKLMQKTKPTFIKTKQALANRLQISRTTLDRYLTRPGAPQPTASGYSLPEMLQFLGEYAERESTREKVDGTIRAAKLRELGLKCDRLKLRLDQERGLMVLRSEVAAAIRRIIPPAKAMLEARLITEYPTAVSGLDVAEARVYGRRLCNSILEALSKLGGEFSALEGDNVQS